jgi:plastocyanin
MRIRQKEVGMRYPRMVIVLALVAALGAACGGNGDGGGAEEGGGVEGGGGGTATDTVTMVDNAFEPTDPSVEAGSTLTLTNDGEAAHTFTLNEGGIDEQVPPGSEASAEITLDPGSYDFVCAFHPEMTGTLTVQ